MTTSDERLSLPSASSMERYFACAGCRALEKAVETQAVKPVEKDSAAASKGTLLHDANETGDVSELEMSDAEAVKKIRAGEEALVRQWCSDHNIDFNTITIIREKRLFMDFPNGRSCTAKLDTLVLADGGHAMALDTKTGRLKVTPPAANWQLRTCALLAAAEFRKDKIRVAIVNLWGQQSPPCDLTHEDILAIEQRLSFRLDLIERPDQPRTPGEHCRWCSAKPICPEQRESLGALIRQRTINWDVILPTQKKDIWLMADMGEKVCKALKEQIRADIVADPASVPGLVKKKDSETRKITDTLGAFFAIKTRYEVDEAAFIPASSISLSAYKELLHEHVGLNSAEAEKFITDHLSPFITKTPKSGSIEIVKE